MSQPKNNQPEYSHERELKVLLEDMRSQFHVFGEGQVALTQKVENLEQQIKADFADVHTKLDRFFGVLSDHETRITHLEKAR